MAEIDFEGFLTMDQLTQEEAAKGEFRPIPEECAGEMVMRPFEVITLRMKV